MQHLTAIQLISLGLFYAMGVPYLYAENNYRDSIFWTRVNEVTHTFWFEFVAGLCACASTALVGTGVPIHVIGDVLVASYKSGWPTASGATAVVWVLASGIAGVIALLALESFIHKLVDTLNRLTAVRYPG